MLDTTCPIEDFDKLVEPLIGRVVARPRKGYGSFIYLDLKKLRPDLSAADGLATDEACLAFNWDWRVECDVLVLYGSSNSGPLIERGIEGLQGVMIESISIAGQVPEITVSFSNGHVIRSMVMVTGDPEWAIKLPSQRWLSARDGQLILVGDAVSVSEEEEQIYAHAESTSMRWGKPMAEPAGGQCRQCAQFVPLDGEGSLLDYGVCTSNESPFDGKVVNCKSGCPAYVIGT